MKKCNVFLKGIISLCLSLLILQGYAQTSRKDLESQRKALETQIKNTSDILKKTQKSKSRSLTQLKTLQTQIAQRQELLNSINHELDRVTKEAEEQERNKNLAEKSISQLESRLTGALRTSYIRSQLQPDWIYLLSAQSLGQALTRWVYLRQYKSYVSGQLNYLALKKNQHQLLLKELEENKKAKTMLFNEEVQNKKEIQQEQKEQEALLKDLGKEEKKLKSQLESSQAKKKKLDDEIARLIKSETEKVTKASKDGMSMAPETKVLNDQFAANKGKLPWPVSKGLITGRFGEHPHPVLKGIMVQNNGIDIQSEGGAGIKSLFNGTVSSVTRIPGYDFMIMVRHGLYFTVYSRVANVSVKKGDTVTTGQIIGHLGNDEPELHLEIWKDKTKLNPESWIARR
jgi:septal ring factor EnvC (AmiA/AmiB activator)